MTKLRESAESVFQKLMSMDNKTFDEFINAHRDGDIAELLLNGNAFTIETASCCMFNEEISSWRTALSIKAEQTTAGTVTLQGIVSDRTSIRSVFTNNPAEEYLWAA